MFNFYNSLHFSSRKSLNIPTSSSTLMGSERAYASQLKRQPLSSAKTELSTSLTTGLPPRRTSTTIHEVQDFEQQLQYAEEQEVADESNINSAYNGRRVHETNMYAANKRQKFLNGSTNLNATEIPETNEAILIDSASESGESAADVTKSNPANMQQQQHQRKTGLFNMSATGTAGNTRNSSRTSSFGNGLNFYSHLEGRKSLFTGQNHGISNPLNNSTLSLTSLNRRQFNASIYGSTSALSDSRLLNTFSPFYKGKTTYGGAAAYNKYTAGAGASNVRITPTLIRPTSSISTLSSSNNSLAANAISQQGAGGNSTISSTAKRILDLINDFATPLSEAKKMASNLKTNPNLQIPPQAKGRLNESDLNASRAMRLSQVRTPYSRPAVILQPSGNANGRGIIGGPLPPPVQELQVPTMSQLLQMKKMQNTTEKARKTTTTQNAARNVVTNTGSTEYTLPEVTTKATAAAANKVTEKQETLQRHTNKIKNKVTNSMRPSNASKDIQDEEPPPPVNLPNIAFPLMQSVPIIDIKLNQTTKKESSNTTGSFDSTFNPTKTTSAKTETNKMTTFAFNTKTVIPTSTLTSSTTPITDCKTTQVLNEFPVNTLTKTTNTFKFSEPLQVKELPPTPNVDHNITTCTKLNKFEFSPPIDVTTMAAPKHPNTIQQPQQPQLKMGSCLDALSKPFSLPTTSKTITTTTIPTTSNATIPLTAGNSGFGNQFKMSTNEWECDACMIRNKADIYKCVACETPRPQAKPIAATQSNPSNSSSLTQLQPSTFGQQFKKSSTEWECDTCMIRNKQESTKCVACETPRKGAASTSAPLPPIKNSFGDAFKPKSGTWECQTCMITNKNEAIECIACQTKKPGAGSTAGTSATTALPTTQFKFGFAAAGISNTTAATTSSSSADAGFKTLAAQQKVSKWECDACMTRNDSNRTKCACCEQPKPGTTNMESASTAANKFTFGATAAAKFSFGFGPAANAPKEEDIKKQLSKTENTKPNQGFAVATTTLSSPTTTGFQFGIKPTATLESKKDETDANKTSTTGFKFGISSDIVKKTETSPTTPATTGLVVAEKPVSTASSSNTNTTTTAVSSPSVKFNLPTTLATTSSNDKPTGVAAPTFSFGNNTSASSTTGGFAFGVNKTETETKPVLEKKSLDSFAFKTPAAVSNATGQSSGFVFGSTTANKTSTTTSVSSSNNTTTTTASSAFTAAVKPMFSFGSPTAASSVTTAASSATPSATAVAPTATSAFGGFSFGSNNTTTTAAAPTTGNTLFGAVTSTSTTTTTAKTTTLSNTTTTTPASTNLFGSFGGGGGGVGGLANASSATTFGSSPNPPANNSTTVSSSTNSSNANTTQFGGFGAKTATTSNVFGSFGGGGVVAGGSSGSKTLESKPTLPVFGNVASSSTSQSSSNSSSFVFGSSNASNTAIAPALGVAGSTTPGSVTSTSATWPKNSFVFGTTAASTTSATPAATPASSNENKESVKPSVFGTFGSSNTTSTNQQQTTSIFGTPAASNTIAPPPAFGTATAGTSNSSTNLFGTNSAPAATNIFGANSSGTAATPAPAFGSSPFGGSASSTSATPTFGSTAASGASTTFGGFGAAAAASNTTATTNSTVEVKKPEAAFNFGAAPATQSTSVSRQNIKKTIFLEKLETSIQTVMRLYISLSSRL